MAKQTTRRGLLTGGAAVLAGFGTLAATSKLLGSKGKTPMRTQTATAIPTTTARTVERVLSATSEHWVGDGFRVRSVIAPHGDPRIQSPFLLLDHAAKRYFAPAAEPRGVGEHPHRGFETVTFAYKGEIEHRDSSGGGGTIGEGDVQWMTAAGGLVHEEFHSRKFTAEGGEMEMVQLWVNLPAKSKLSKPGYQALLDKDFPRLQLGAARARLVAGSLGSEQGPAHTHSPVTVFDLTFTEAGRSSFELESHFNSLVFVLEGEVKVGADGQKIKPGDLAVLTRGEVGEVRIDGAKGARVLVLSGEPIAEPVAAYGPFVMNTQAEIMEAIRDYQSGKMGHLAARG
jgi:redox-sensitive bicupin YhaK (pirin superfamily)